MAQRRARRAPLAAVAALGLLACCAEASPSSSSGASASAADLRRGARDSSASTPDASAMIRLRRAGARRLRGSQGVDSSDLGTDPVDGLIECFQRDCDRAAVTLSSVAACMVCLAPWSGKSVTLADAIAELERSGLDLVSKKNPYNVDIPDEAFEAKSNNDSPLGYTHLCKGDVAHCKPAYGDDCYGPNSVCLTTWQDVMDWGPQIPEGQWNGTLWRGQELGTGFLSPYLWSTRGIDPYTALGVTPKQHYAIRPQLEKSWSPGTKYSAEYRQTEEMVRAEVRQFLEERKQKGLQVGLPGDIMVFVHRVLYKHVFKQEISESQAKSFVLLQLLVLESALQSEDTDVLAKVPGVYPSIRDEIARLVQSYEPMVEAVYGDILAGEDCSPSKSCVTQVASATLDAFLLAGGVSLTLSINTGIALLFSTAEPSGTPFSGDEEVLNPPEAWKHWGNPFPQRAYEPGQELQYYWEVLRYFAPVGSLASWKVGPTCNGESADQTKARLQPEGGSEPCKLGPVDPATGIPKINQYAGGSGHVFPSLPVAQRDPTKFGADAFEFKIRDLEVYKWSVGFGEMAVNDKVADGRMNRVCPGKSLTLMIGSIFFEEFNKEDWMPPRIAANITFTQGSKPTSQGGMPFDPSFTLSSKAMVAECKEACPSILSYAKEAQECLAARAECMCARCKAEGVLDKIGDFDCVMCLR